MANKVQLKAAGDQGHTDDDPFAELTRIMGFDPRVQPTPRPDEDFEIDLEKELMGMFDPGPDAPIGPVSAEDYPQETADRSPADQEMAAEDIDEAFAANLEEELSARAEPFAAAEGQEPGGESHVGEPDAGESDAGEYMQAEVRPADDAGAEGSFDDLAEVDMDFRAEARHGGGEPGDAGGAYAAEEDFEGVVTEAPAFEDRNVYRPASFTQGYTMHSASEQAGAESDAGRAAAPVFDIRSFKSAAQQYREAHPVQEARIDEEAFPPDDVRAETSSEEAAPRAKAIDPFDILAALGTERSLPQRRDPIKGKAYADTPEMPEQPDMSVVAASPEVEEPETPAYGTAYFEAEGQPPATGAVETEQEASAADAAEAVPFMDIRPAGPAQYVTVETADEADGGPVSGSEPETPEIETTEIEEPAIAIADDLDIPVPAFLTEARPAPVFDELDEEFEQAFQTLSQQGDAIRQAAFTPAEASPAQAGADIERLFAEELGIGSAVAVAAAQPMSAGAAQARGGVAHRADDALDTFEFDDADFLPEEFSANAQREMDDAFAAEEAGAERRAAWAASLPQGRGKLVAAALAGAVVLGGIGVFAFSGSGSITADQPVVLKADAHPVKVKPKNPGGMTVPNQDNKVYERVADGATAVAPEQKKLVSAEVQPVDISAQAKNAASALPGVFDGDQFDDTAAGDGDTTASTPADAASKGDVADLIKGAPAQPSAAPKGEDRLSPSQNAAPVRGDNDVLTVTPHKVKTMIVRADGTMVPREEPVSAEPASVSASQAAAEKVDAAAGTATNLPSAAPIPTREPAAAPAAAEVARAPSRPTDQPAAAKPQKVASAEPAPAQAPVAAASGDWSMQIASQPTAEAAQKSYQNMARRYASVLGGHAANIVKADIAGKGTYYRVRIAAGSKEDAIALCGKFKAAGGSCFVSK